jgi:DNA-binding NtrC family response regulator
MRLDVLRFELAPLRERREDIRPIALHIVEEWCRQSKKTRRLDPGALTKLEEHAWPGNVRELENTLVAACIASSSVITASDLELVEAAARPPSGLTSREQRDAGYRAALARHEGNVREAAKELGVARSTLHRFQRRG